MFGPGSSAALPNAVVAAPVLSAARQLAQVSGQGLPNGGSGCPGCPIRSCSISCRTTSSLLTQALEMKMLWSSFQ